MDTRKWSQRMGKRGIRFRCQTVLGGWIVAVAIFALWASLSPSVAVAEGAAGATAGPSINMNSLVAGSNSVGTTGYPNGGMLRMDAVDIGGCGAVVIDQTSGYAYYGLFTSPGRVVKAALGNGNEPMTVVGEVEFEAGENQLVSGVIDTANGYAYFGTDTMPGRVVKVRLGSGDAPPERIGSVVFSTEEDSPRCAAIDPAAGYAYFGAYSGMVVKVSLGAGDALPTRIGAAELSHSGLSTAVIDPGNGYAYFGTNGFPGDVVKVALGAGANLPTEVGGIALQSEERRLWSSVIDAANGHAYFGTNPGHSHFPTRVVKVALGSGAVSPARIGAIDLGDEIFLGCAVADVARGYAWFGTDTHLGRVVKVAMRPGNQLPMRLGAITLNSGEGRLSNAIIDTDNGYAYWSGSSHLVTRTALSHKGFVKATRFTLLEEGAIESVSFYSHAASGNLRLGLYDVALPPTLLWESDVKPNTVAEGWLATPIAQGTPTFLTLPAGDYWLAWQTDSTADVPSYAEGSPGEGLIVPHVWGPFPSELHADVQTEPTLTTDRWSAYVTCGETVLCTGKFWMALE